jgi:hypothetical protein
MQPMSVAWVEHSLAAKAQGGRTIDHDAASGKALKVPSVRPPSCSFAIPVST